MSVFKRSDGRSGNYYFYVRHQSGKASKRSTGTCDKRLAEKIRAKYLLEAQEDKALGREPDRSFKELIVIYLEAKTRSRGFKRLWYASQPLLQAFGTKDVRDIDVEAIERYIGKRYETVGDGTINRELGVLSAAYNYAIGKRGWKVVNPVVGCKLSEPEGRVRWITRAEAAGLIQAADCPTSFSAESREKVSFGRPLTSQYRSPYLRDFIELALNTGCRKQELLGLTWGNVDFSNDLILLEQTKNGTRRSVPLNSVSRGVLIRRRAVCAEVCPDTPWVFFHITAALHAKVGDRVKDVKTSFATACKKAGIVDFRIHDLRHTAASWLVMEGVPLLEVSRLLGHKSITQTERYAHLAPESSRALVGVLEGKANSSSTLSTTWTAKRQRTTRMT